MLLTTSTTTDPATGDRPAEVFEHVDEDRLPALEHAVSAVARPATVVVARREAS